MHNGRGGETIRLHELLTDIHCLKQDLMAFERKFGVRSETFYAAYASGEEPAEEEWVLDFAEWAGIYGVWMARQAQYRDLVQQEQAHHPGLASLVRVAP